jgi:hypothetical protein
MGLKYSINSAGRIVAERDIYSLGGFIPKGRLGGFIADETQLSQEGECWLSSGDISTRPDVRLKDNAYIGDFFTNENPVHTDGIMEFSGDTLIPGYITVRCPQADPNNNVIIKDSFIGVSMDVLCGPATTTTAFPFEQGDFKKEAAKGTLFTSASMRLDNVSACRNTAILLQGRNTYLYIPTGYRARVFWAYYDTSNQLAYSGESTAVAAGLTKLDHLVYKLAMVAVAKSDGTAMTPEQLGTSGAKILGHISGSLLQDLRPESASGEYAMVNSSLIAETDNFGLNATQLRFLAGSMYDTTMYTKTDRQDYKLYGTFWNVERLEYTKYLGDSYRTAATRDTCISAYDCPLLRVDNTTYNDALAAKGNLVLRRCIVPKAIFTDNIHNGNVYEDIDFSYASDHLGAKAGNNFDMWSSHKQGEYAAIGEGTAIAGLISRPENLAAGSILGAGIDFLPLDGSIVEQGAYEAGSNLGVPYEETKVTSAAVVRSYKPVSTESLSLPTMPSGYVLDAIVYLDESFIIRRVVANPASIENTYQYAVMQFRRADTSGLNVSDFIALGLSLRYHNYSNVPEITGSAYVGAGCTVRGDVQLHGYPYVNRVLDVNMWERGSGATTTGETWEVTKVPEAVGYPRLRTRDVFPVDATADNNFTCASGYNILIYYFGADGKCSGYSSWVTSLRVSDPAVAYISIIVKKADGTESIDFSDIPLANVKYVRAFKKRRYIVNELDRTSPEDILLSVDYWEQGTAGGGQADAGKTYEELKATSGTTIRLKRPINVSPTSSISSASGFSRYIRVLDAVTKFHLGEPLNSAKMALLAAIIQKNPSAAITPSEIANSRLVLEFVPQPRIIAPYGVSNVWIEGTNVRMYDNSVISRTITKGQEVTLKGDAVMGTVFIGDVCICSNGHDDAIIKQP